MWYPMDFISKIVALETFTLFFFNDSESGSKVGYSLNIFSQVSVNLEYVGREKYENWGRGRSGI